MEGDIGNHFDALRILKTRKFPTSTDHERGAVLLNTIRVFSGHEDALFKLLATAPHFD